MSILIFVISYLLLSILFGAIFILFLLIGCFISQRKAYFQKKSNEEWNQSLIDKKGRKTYLILLDSYLIATVAMFPLSHFGFNFIGFRSSKLATLVVWLVISITIIIKLPKFKSTFQEKFNKYSPN